MSDWNYAWFGFWSGSDQEENDLPKIQDWVDGQWNPEDKVELLKYVEKSPVVIAGMPKTLCLLCEECLSASAYQSDGIWLWPVTLNHYIKNHAVRLPESLVAHIRSRNYKYPLEVDAALEDLPWPD